MKHISPEELKRLFDTKLFHLIGETADELGLAKQKVCHQRFPKNKGTHFWVRLVVQKVI